MGAWYPGAQHRAGEAAGYRFGRTNMTSVVCHYTVGRNSTPIGLRGYFHFLIGRDGAVTQFCEADAVAYHAGQPWNSRGPGIEIEFLPGADDVLFTLEALAATSGLVHWLNTTYGIPLSFYDGDRIREFNGFITHRSLIQTGDAHSDYWTHDDWYAIAGAPQEPTPTKKRHHDMTVAFVEFNGIHAYLIGGSGRIIHQFTGTPNPQYGLPQDALDYANSTNCGIVKLSGEEWTRALKLTKLA